MPNLVNYNEENRIHAAKIAQRTSQSVDLALAYIESTFQDKRCRAMEQAARDRMCKWIHETYFPHNQMSDAMQAGIISVVCDAHGKLSKSEVVKAIELAASGRLTDVSLDAPLTPQLIGKILSAYETQKRGDLISAYIAIENQKKKAENQRGFVILTEADMESCRESIRNYARNFNKKPNKKWYYMDYIQPHLQAGAIKDISEEAKGTLRKKAESQARVEEYQYRQQRGRQGFVSIGSVMDFNETDYERAFQAEYAHELIALNLDYFLNKF
jgi:hypothetical protein